MGAFEVIGGKSPEGERGRLFDSASVVVLDSISYHVCCLSVGILVCLFVCVFGVGRRNVCKASDRARLATT